MKYFAILLLLISYISTFGQENNISHFTFEAVEEKLKLTASIGEENLDILLKEKISCEIDDRSVCATRYLSQNFMTIINGDVVKYQLDSSKVDNDQFLIYYHIDFKPEELYEVWIKTSFLLDISDSHSNDVVFDVNGNKQSVSLNKDKPVTQFYF